MLLAMIMLFSVACNKDIESQQDIEKILKQSTVIYCLEPDGTILYSVKDDVEFESKDIPNDAILFLLSNEIQATYGMWDMSTNEWMIAPTESKPEFYEIGGRLRYICLDGEYMNLQFTPLTEEDYAALYLLGADDVKIFVTDADNEYETNISLENNSEEVTDSSTVMGTIESNPVETPEDVTSQVTLPEKPSSPTGLTPAQAYERFWEEYYPGLTYEDIDKRLTERHSYARNSYYTQAVSYYWERVMGVTDVGNRIDPMFFTSYMYYDAEDFAEANADVLKIAKNEIYARHGYIFNNQDLYNYFMGCTWYEPKYTSDEFDASVFNEYEVYNLKLIEALSEQ